MFAFYGSTAGRLGRRAVTGREGGVVRGVFTKQTQFSKTNPFAGPGRAMRSLIRATLVFACVCRRVSVNCFGPGTAEGQDRPRAEGRRTPEKRRGRRRDISGLFSEYYRLSGPPLPASGKPESRRKGRL